MKVVAILFDPASGKRATVEENDDAGTEDGSWYMWNEGNWACDCNRRLLMARALGEPEPDPETLRCTSEVVLESLTFDGVAQTVIQSQGIYIPAARTAAYLRTPAPMSPKQERAAEILRLVADGKIRVIPPLPDPFDKGDS